ncbi:hypothetical protein ABPG72_017505 [Tetrahymena utriculariae]
MESIEYFQQSYVQEDSNLWLSSIIVSSSQLNQNSVLVEDTQFKTFFKPQSILNQIEEKSIQFVCVENKDVIFVLGSTGSGKSTTINFLMGKKMVFKRIPVSDHKPGYEEIISEDQEQISTEEEDDEFKIGFKKESQTLFLKAKQMANSDFFICDTPGFKDSRGFEVELSNTICLTNFVKKCRSICPILTINYYDLLATRGELFKDILFSFSKFIEIESIDKVLYYFTHVPDTVNINRIKNQISLIYLSLLNNLTPQLQKLLDSILDSFKKNKAFILKPVKDDPVEYLNFIKVQCKNQQFVNDPQNTFKINLSEDTLTKLKIYSEDLLQYVTKCTQNGFIIEQLIEVLSQYLKIQYFTEIEYMGKKYNQYIDRVLKYAALTKRIAFENLQLSKNVQSYINERYLNQLKTCLGQSEKIDKFRDPHFKRYESSYDQVVEEIQQVINELSDKIKEVLNDLYNNMIINFNNQIEQGDLKQVKFNLIKIEQLSKLSTKFQSSYFDIKKLVNQQLSTLIQKNIYLEEYLSEKLCKTFLNKNIELIASSFKIFQEIDSQLDQKLLGNEKEWLFSKYKLRLDQVLSQQSKKLTQNVIEIKDKLSRNETPDTINFKQIISEQQFFEINVLLQVNANKYFSENVEFYEQYYNQMKDNIQTLQIAILEYLNKNSEKKKYLTRYQDAINTFQEIRKINEVVQCQREINQSYNKLIQRITYKIQLTKINIKNAINLIESNNKIERGMIQLKKYLQFLDQVTWIDDQFKIRCVQQTKQNIKNKIQKCFESCIESCEELIKDQNFKKLNTILKRISKFEEIKDLIQNFQQNYDTQIMIIRQQITQRIDPIQFQITNIVKDPGFPTQNQLKDIDEYLKYKTKIDKMQNSCIYIENCSQYTMKKPQVQEEVGKDVVKKVVIQINNNFEHYFEEKFEEFKMLFKNCSLDQIKKIIQQENQGRGLSYWKNYLIMIDFCSKECLQIMDIIQKEQFNQAITNVKIAFQELLAYYRDIKNDEMNLNSNYLVEVSSQYEILIKFVNTFSNLESLFFMKLFVIENSKSAVKQSIQNIQRAIKQNCYSDTKSYIEQLKQLSDEYSKNALQTCLKQLGQSQNQIIAKIEYQVQQGNNQFCFDESDFVSNSQESFKEKEQNLNLLKKQNNLQYKQEIEALETAVLNSLRQLLNSYSIMSKKIREQEIEQIIEYLKYENHFSTQVKEEIDKLLLSLQSSIETFLDQPEENLKKLEQFQKLLDYNHLVNQLNQKSKISHSLENLVQKFQNKISNFVNYLKDIEKNQKELIKMSNQMTEVTKFKEIYEFTLRNNELINFYTTIKNELYIDGNLVHLNFWGLDQVEDSIKKYFQNIKNLIKTNFKQSNFDKLKENLEILKQNNGLNKLFKKKLFDYEEELQNIQLETQNIIYLVIEKICQQHDDQKNYKIINLLYDFQDKLQRIEGLDISAQLENIQNNFINKIDHFAFTVIFDNKILDREIIFYKVSQEFANSEGKVNDIINCLIKQSINQLF